MVGREIYSSVEVCCKVKGSYKAGLVSVITWSVSLRLPVLCFVSVIERGMTDPGSRYREGVWQGVVYPIKGGREKGMGYSSSSNSVIGLSSQEVKTGPREWESQGVVQDSP